MQGTLCLCRLFRSVKENAPAIPLHLVPRKKYKNQKVFFVSFRSICQIPSVSFVCEFLVLSISGAKIIVSVFWYVGRSGGPRGKEKCEKRGQARPANKNKSGRRESTRLAGQTGFSLGISDGEGENIGGGKEFEALLSNTSGNS